MACSFITGSNSMNSTMGIVTHSHSHDSDKPIFQNECQNPSTPPLDAIVKMEYEDCDLQVLCPAFQTDAGGVEKTSVNVISLPKLSLLCDVPASVKVEGSEILLSSVDNGRKTSLQIDFPASKVKKEINEDVDALDHLVLKERQRMLLARKLSGSSAGFEGHSGGLLENIIDEKVNDEIHSVDGKTTITRDQCYEIPERSNASLSVLPPGATTGLLLSPNFASPISTKSLLSAGLQEHDHEFEPRGSTMQFDSYVQQGIMPIKNDSSSTSTCPTSVKIKDEPWDNNDLNNVDKDAIGSISVEIPNVKSEWEVHNEYHHDDQVEHISLIDRLNFIMSGEDSSSNIATSYPSLKKIWPSAFIASSSVSESAEYSGIKHIRKRKKTATDSVQTALEEDAPGLLQALLDKGVLVDEIKLYGESGDDEPLDESLCEDSFSELEAVISKIFSQRHSFFKIPITRVTKASRASYCLACLISLVEQTQYLQFRKWPVEWGWCRDLQSFIFVFERHNRIVLERPEYGYATYFFELVDSLPTVWQIKRLVTTMKLTTCSRISLIENKELLVGEDLSEGEAKVLMEYGWTPNSGLGTMLNYRDRVVHDRKNEKDTSEWRSKIGKLLMDGYNSGTIVMPSIPKKVEQYRCAGSPISD
ncbi:PREDICTED: uncharacterized protein LOC109339707 isoform X1 [Lupinus angustifolius]|uniref:uncharacterized protein LOC109339707 isoform X1 n=1 Tax=Lupinus angustifolius TaxID=3871 RepID=UPI00092F02E8|nr:PREDICTED: uncharacterized protein LOC109339707 isoform X1 [Lupinus angustifolius]